MRYNTYLFDFDGTLVDSMQAFASVMLKILDENGVSYPPDIIKTVTPLGCPKIASYFKDELGLNMSENAILELMYLYLYDEYAHNIQAKKTVKETLVELKRRGASLNVLTASPHITLDVCLRRLGLLELFDNVWSCDDFKTSKTDPDIYRRASERLGVPIDGILFVDDNYNADLAAKKSGIAVSGIYDLSSADYADEIKRVADYYIYELSEILYI